jgi:hypothetical protein
MHRHDLKSSLRVVGLLAALLGPAACSSRSVSDAARDYSVASHQLRADIEQLNKSLDALKANWDVSEQAGQARVHFDRLLASVKAESLAEDAHRRGDLIEAKAIAAIRDETTKVLESDATVRSILLHVEQLRTYTMRSTPLLQETHELLDRARGALAGATWLSPEDRELLQAKVDVCGRRLSELQSLIGTGLTWTLSPIDGQKGITTVETAMKELAALDATLREIVRDIDDKRPK